jgi:hypothetical protein
VALSLITVLQLPGNYSAFLLDASLLCYATNTPQLWSLSLPLIFLSFPRLKRNYRNKWRVMKRRWENI